MPKPRVRRKELEEAKDWLVFLDGSGHKGATLGRARIYKEAGAAESQVERLRLERPNPLLRFRFGNALVPFKLVRVRAQKARNVSALYLRRVYKKAVEDAEFIAACEAWSAAADMRDKALGRLRLNEEDDCFYTRAKWGTQRKKIPLRIDNGATVEKNRALLDIVHTLQAEQEKWDAAAAQRVLQALEEDEDSAWAASLELAMEDEAARGRGKNKDEASVQKEMAADFRLLCIEVYSGSKDFWGDDYAFGRFIFRYTYRGRADPDGMCPDMLLFGGLEEGFTKTGVGGIEIDWWAGEASEPPDEKRSLGEALFDVLLTCAVGVMTAFSFIVVSVVNVIDLIGELLWSIRTKYRARFARKQELLILLGEKTALFPRFPQYIAFKGIGAEKAERTMGILNTNRDAEKEDEIRERLTPFTIRRVSGIVSNSSSCIELFEVYDEAVQDAELDALLEEYRGFVKNKTREDEVLGTLEVDRDWDSSRGSLDGTVKLGRRKVGLRITGGKTEAETEAQLDIARKLSANLKAWDEKAHPFLRAEIAGMDRVEHENEEELDKIVQDMRLSCLEVYDGRFALTYCEGRGGYGVDHDIRLTGSLEGGIDDAGMDG